MARYFAHIKSTGARTRLGLAMTVCALALTVSRTGAQREAPSAVPANFDIRTDESSAAASYVTRYVPPSIVVARGLDPQAAAVARLRNAVGAVDVQMSRELRMPEVVRAMPGTPFLTAESADRVTAMREFLSSYADVYGVSPAAVDSLDLVSESVNPAGNLAWVEFAQRINGVPVFQGLIRGAFTTKGELAATTGLLAPGLDGVLLDTIPTLSAASAVAAAAASVGWQVDAAGLVRQSVDGGRVTFAGGSMDGEAHVWPVYFPLGPGAARLAWATAIWGTPDAFLLLVDAQDGTVLFRKNATAYQSQQTTYAIYDDDSPAPMSPSTVLPGAGTQAPFIGRTLRTLIGNEAPNTFNNLGWMTDGTAVTDGNNVQAGVDRISPDGVDASVTCTRNRNGLSRVCSDVGFKPQVDDPTKAGYQNAEVVDTFYWTNVYHDRLYLLGFTESAGNFQNDNFSRGGAAGDRVSAEAQDSSGTNNANFATFPDGIRGRMQMYIFPGPAPDRSSGLDHDVLLHELTHGTSNRLHNGATGLSTTMSRAMGEGWSDFYARALLSTADEDPSALYSTGGWLTYQFSTSTFTDNYYYGIRRFPYASISRLGANGKPHNPLTFADIDAAQINTTDGAYPRNPVTSSTALEVHNAGEVWASALFEVRARFITRLGWAVGNQRILQFVTDAMKLDPINPTFLQGRDSIVAAANAGGGTGADLTDIWAGFAARGMGISASVTNATTGVVVQAFNTPLSPAGATITSESIPTGTMDPTEVVGVSLCIVNATSATSGSVTGTLLATGGVTSPSAPQSYGVLASGSAVCRTYTLTVGSSCGATLKATLQAQETGGSGATWNLVYSFPVGAASAPVTMLSQNFDAVTAPALPIGWATSKLSGADNLWVTSTVFPDTAPNSALVNNPAAVSDNVLTSPAFTPAANSVSKLTFRHYYLTDTNYDGGVLEIAIGGGAFQDILAAGGSFDTGGYTGPLNGLEGNPLGTRQAWSGSSAGYVTTVVTMPAAAAGQSVVLRWRLGTGSSVSASGWLLDATTVTATTYSCSSFTSGPGDVDGDRQSDIAVYRPSTGQWFVRSSKGIDSGFSGVLEWGQRDDVPLVGDFDGDGRTEITVYRPSTGQWFMRYSAQNYSSAAFGNYQWGSPGDLPLVADFDGDHRSDLTVYRPLTGQWFVRYSSQGYRVETFGTYQLGSIGDVPLAADFDGDSKSELTVYRPRTGQWLVLSSSEAYDIGRAGVYQWGAAGDLPIIADFDGDKRSEVTVYRPSSGEWLVRYSANDYATGASGRYQLGRLGDQPIVADFDADGRTDLTVYRPSSGEWLVRRSSEDLNAGSTLTYRWGSSGDSPVTGSSTSAGPLASTSVLSFSRPGSVPFAGLGSASSNTSGPSATLSSPAVPEKDTAGSPPASDSWGGAAGRVADSDGHPVEGARVRVSPGSYTAETDADGAYAIRMPAGTYTVTTTAGLKSATAEAVAIVDRIVISLDLVVDEPENVVPVTGR